MSGEIRQAFDAESHSKFRDNDYTGTVFTNILPPELFNRFTIEPVQLEQRRARDQVQRLFEAFRTYSQCFRIELIGARPFLGDLKIVELSTKHEIFVELKRSLYNIILDGPSESTILQHPSGVVGAPIFSSQAQWDYILTADAALTTAYMLPRDEITAHWWNASTLNDGMLEMTEDFQEHCIDLRRRRESVATIEKIFWMVETNAGSMRV